MGIGAPRGLGTYLRWLQRRRTDRGPERAGRRMPACPRLVAWREEVAADPPRRYRGERYWARPVPGFRRPRGARSLIVGLAPAAHGANRTGRMFTGDRSGDWLYAALHRAGLANQPTCVSRATTGSAARRLHHAPSTAARRRPTSRRRPSATTAFPTSPRSWRCSSGVRVIVCLGSFAWDGALRALRASGHRRSPKPKPRFGHGAEAEVGPYTLLGCVPPQPAEHVHRQAHRADAGRGVRPGAGTGRDADWGDAA